jgi:hypothetical protein
MTVGRYRILGSSSSTGSSTTLLEELCNQARSLGAEAIEVEYKDSEQWVFASKGGMGFGIASYPRSSAQAEELRKSLYAAAKKQVRTVMDGQAYVLKVRRFDSFGEDAFAVSINPARKAGP